METSQEEYDQAPVLVKAELLGTKKSLILDEGERETMTFNRHDIANTGSSGTAEHFLWMNKAAAKNGDALISYVVSVNDSDIVAASIHQIMMNAHFDLEISLTEINKNMLSFRNLERSFILSTMTQVLETYPRDVASKTAEKELAPGIKQLLIGNYFSFYQAENIDHFNDDTFLDKQIRDVLRNEGNADGFPVFFAEYLDNSFALVFSYFNDKNEKMLFGSLSYKMRQLEPMNDCFIYNDAHPGAGNLYTATLTLSKPRTNEQGWLIVFKQTVSETEAIRLVGFLRGAVVEGDDILGSPEVKTLSDFYYDGYLIEDEPTD